MADLVITLKGDAGDFKKQFDQAIASLNKFSNETKAGQGYIGSMESQLKLLKTQMRSASEQDLPALRTQFLNLKNAVREAQYGTESFTKKIGGEFDSALSRAGKKLFDLGNILKASIGAFGVAGLVSSFVQATGAADALNNEIQNLVNGLKLLNKTGVEISISGTKDVIDAANKFITSQVPADEQMVLRLNDKIKSLQNTKQIVDPLEAVKAAAAANLGINYTPGFRALTKQEQEDINKQIIELQNLIDKINALKKSGGASGGGVADIQISSPFGEALANSRTSSAYDAFIFERRQREIEARREASRRALLEQDKLREQQEEAVNKLIRHEEQKRVEMMDRVGARIAQTFEDAVSAGMRGGFDEFLRNYMQQVGLKTFSGLLRLAFSSATGGSFGVGGLLGHIFGFAGGGEFYTKGPMPIIVGDNPGGIEKVTVEPISGRGTSGLKNGNLALAGGGTVMSAPMGQGTPEIIFRPIIKFDSYDMAYVLEAPNGGYEKLDKQRGRS